MAVHALAFRVNAYSLPLQRLNLRIMGETATVQSIEYRRTVLNVGGGNRSIGLSAHYRDWNAHWLDVDRNSKPDILLDARHLCTLNPNSYDAVYCSHTLEHFFAHEVPAVLAGFVHVLKEDGFAEIRVPDVGQALKIMADREMDIEDTLYVAPAGPVAVRDVLYGMGKIIEQQGTDLMAHKTGFSLRSLRRELLAGRFRSVVVLPDPEDSFGIRAFAFKGTPSDWQESLLGLTGAFEESVQPGRPEKEPP